MPVTLFDLTAREQETAKLVAMGLSNAQIAKEMDIAIVTVKVNINSVCVKLGKRGRVRLAAWAYSHHLVNPNNV